MTVLQIKSAIETLSEQELGELRSWLAEMVEQKNAAWDAEIERDSQPGGGLDELITKARAQIREGRIKPLDEVLRDH